MADTENNENPTLTAKRKLDPFPISKYNAEVKGEENQQHKHQKLQFLAHNDISVPNDENSPANLTLEPSNTNCASNLSIPAEKSVTKVQSEENEGAEVDEEEEEEEDDDADFEDEEEEENGEVASVDRKGKGIMIEEEPDDSDVDDEDDDSSDDGGSEVDSDCNELEDDPLAEVDLDNILPSRTRRRSVQPGVYIANDIEKNDNDDSDASDA